jgi:hydrogenase maturation protease
MGHFIKTCTDPEHSGLCTTTILIIGLGNPILGDDAVGIHVARMLKRRFQTAADLEFKELSVGGLRLVEEMLGFETVFLIDSIEGEESKVGEIREFSADDFKTTQRSSAPHVTNFATALELYNKLEPSKVPRNMKIFTIGIHGESTFREGLSPHVGEAASKLADLVAREIEHLRV